MVLKPGHAELAYRARRRFLTAWKPDVVIAIDRWDSYGGKPGQFEARLRGFVAEIGRKSRSILLFNQIPVLEVGEELNLREYVSWKARHAGELPEIGRSSFEPNRVSANRVLEEVAHGSSAVRVLEVDEPFLGEGGTVRWHFGREFAYADDDHLSEAGAEKVHGLVSRAIDDALGAAPASAVPAEEEVAWPAMGQRP